MFKHVLVPVDGSPTSTLALKYGLGIAKAFDASLTAMTVFDPYPIMGAGLDYTLVQDHYQEAVRAEANATIQAARKQIEDEGRTAHVELVESQRTWRAILETADTLKVDLIVLGSHGRSGLDKLVMGSVTQRVLQHTRLPVLVVRD